MNQRKFKRKREKGSEHSLCQPCHGSVSCLCLLSCPSSGLSLFSLTSLWCPVSCTQLHTPGGTRTPGTRLTAGARAPEHGGMIIPVENGKIRKSSDNGGVGAPEQKHGGLYGHLAKKKLIKRLGVSPSCGSFTLNTRM